MKSSHNPQAKFIKTAVLPKDFPIIRNDSGKILPEIAVAGRSNVGKSSLLNHYFHSKNLVKTSSTPGKTQALNFFTYQNIAYADLPGYGYASVPLSVRKQWGPMIQNYLENRETLKLILFLVDIRRTPSEEDKQFLTWIQYYQKPVILILTKVDKVNQSEKVLQTRKILEEFNASELNYIYYSVPKNIGQRELNKLINEVL